MDEVDNIIEAMCDGYCMWPEEYMAYYHDPDDAIAAMQKEKCADCPLQKLKEAIE